MTITINNKTYEFKFSMKALRNLEKQTGKKTSEIIDSFSKVEEMGVDYDVLSIILCEGLKSSMPEITIEQTDDILDNGGGGDLVVVMQAFSAEVSAFWTKNLPNVPSLTQ
jgi:hypothetical protein